MWAALTSLADLTLGRSCAGCDLPGYVLCDRCRQALHPTVRLRRDLDVGDVAEDLRIPVACALDYAGVTRQIMYRYKDHRVRELAHHLAPALASSIEFAAERSGVASGHYTVVPVPTRRSSVRRRGFDATALLADRALARTRFGCVRHLLLDVRSGGSIKGAGAAERERGSVDAFVLKPRIAAPTTPVIVMDDIVTTGATIKEAVWMLLLAGVHVVAVAAVAGTP